MHTARLSSARLGVIALLLCSSVKFVSAQEDKLLHIEIEKDHHETYGENFKRLSEGTVPIDINFVQGPYIYTGQFQLGSNKQTAKMRFTTDTDWSMVTGKDCYRCVSQAYNKNTSVTAQNGTFFDAEKAVGQLKYAGYSVKDNFCVGGTTTCVPGFEFFVITNDTEQRTELQRCDGIMGLAPDSDDNGPSFMTSLRNLSYINKLQISMEMKSMNAGKSKMTFGGYDKASLKPYPAANDTKIYWYDNKYDDKEWGTEMRNMLIGNLSLDSGTQVYAKIDSFSPYIQIPTAYFDKFFAYMNTSHPEMACTSALFGFGICYATNRTCESIISTYENITIRFNDTMGFTIPPTSYLKSDKTPQNIPMCYHMVITSGLNPNIVVLGDTFMENYLVIYDFENTTIGLNGWAIEGLPIEPPRPPADEKSNTTIIVIIIAIAVVAIAGGIAAFILIRRRNAKLEENLTKYEKLDSQVYQRPTIK